MVIFLFIYIITVTIGTQRTELERRYSITTPKIMLRQS